MAIIRGAGGMRADSKAEMPAPDDHRPMTTWQAMLLHLDLFLQENCQTGANCFVAYSDLYARYRWALEDTEPGPMTKRMLGDQLRLRGFVESRTADHRHRIWLGLRLHDLPTDTPTNDQP